ncbi:MAG TPA: hypothetical protein VLA93_01285 [Pyrinomonadaceae bacterium]|nr:hypothetical protein [Pyrinomonadaceae bacterium]
MTICPCCGFKFNGALTDGCAQCGARAVGVALPKPAIELPSYGRSLVLAVAGSLTVLLFAVQTIIAMFQRGFDPFGFWSWVAAAETAAWRLKWISIPIAAITLWLGRKLYRSIKQRPDRFCGIRYARRGLLASLLVPALVAILIGVTVPTRLQRRAWGIEAANTANYLRLSSALHEYRAVYKTLPDRNRLKEELAKLPDPDGSLAIALRESDTIDYQPRAEIAANSTEKRSLRGAAIQRVSLTTATDDSTPAGLAFTHYDLVLPGEDKVLGTEDDWVDRDGVVMRLADVAKGGIGQTAGSLRP